MEKSINMKRVELWIIQSNIQQALQTISNEGVVERYQPLPLPHHENIKLMKLGNALYSLLLSKFNSNSLTSSTQSRFYPL